MSFDQCRLVLGRLRALRCRALSKVVPLHGHRDRDSEYQPPKSGSDPAPGFGIVAAFSGGKDESAQEKRKVKRQIKADWRMVLSSMNHILLGAKIGQIRKTRG